MSKPYQFIGYWGIGSQEKQEIVLAKVLNAVTSWGQPKQFRWSTEKASLENNLIWGVSYISSDRKPGTEITQEGIIASISAAGLPHIRDAWVRLKDNHLILGREPFGHVPLYWIQLEKFIWFASRLQLLLILIKKPQVSIPGLYGYSCFSCVPTPLTPVENIFSISAGSEEVWQLSTESMSMKHTSHRLHEWQSTEPLIEDEETGVVQLQSLLKDAIHWQLESLPSEPVGVFLSGSLESSTVAALLAQAGIKVRAYTLDFGSVGIQELAYAQQVANFLDIPLVKVEVTPSRIKSALKATATALDLPFGDSVTIPLYLLYQIASQETAVIFNGEGGSQLFGGRTNKHLTAARVYNTEHLASLDDFTEQYLGTFQRLYGYEERVFQSQVSRQVQAFQPQACLQHALDPDFSVGLLNRLRRANLMLKGAQNIHPRATNLALAQGMVVRSPFCDLPLAEWTFQLSAELLLRDSCEKYILKRAVESWLPSEVVWQQKRRGVVPITQWYLTELWPEVGHWLNPGVLNSEGRWVRDLARQVILGQLGGKIKGRRIGEILWLLIIWQAWRTHVLGEAVLGYSAINSFWLPYGWWKKLAAWQVRRR